MREKLRHLRATLDTGEFNAVGQGLVLSANLLPAGQKRRQFLGALNYLQFQDGAGRDAKTLEEQLLGSLHDSPEIAGLRDAVTPGMTTKILAFLVPSEERRNAFASSQAALNVFEGAKCLLRMGFYVLDLVKDVALCAALHTVFKYQTSASLTMVALLFGLTLLSLVLTFAAGVVSTATSKCRMTRTARVFLRDGFREKKEEAKKFCYFKNNLDCGNILA